MDLDRKIKEIAQVEEHGTRMNKTLIELTSELHGIQRDVKDLQVQMANCLMDEKRIDTELIISEYETQVSGKQLDIVRNDVYHCVKMLMMAECELETSRGEYWNKVNKYIDGVNEYLSKVRQVRSENSVNNMNTVCRPTEMEFKIKGELEALEMYAKYQVKKIKTLSEYVKRNYLK